MSPSTSEEITMKLQEQTVSIPTTSSANSVNKFDGSREDYLSNVVPLYEASVMGDWESAKSILEKRRELIRCGLSNEQGSPLHVAAGAKESKASLHFVKNLVDMMTPEELELQNQFSNTAFWIACAQGHLEIAKIMLKKNLRLLSIRGIYNLLPLSISARSGTYDAVKYLYNYSQKMACDHWEDVDKYLTVSDCLKREFFDVALQFVKDHPELISVDVALQGVQKEDTDQLAAKPLTILGILARKSDAFNRVEKKLITRVIEPICRFFHMKVQPEAEEVADALKLLKIVWADVSRTMNYNEIEDMLRGSPSLLFVAAEMGNTRFIVELLRTYPDLMLYTNEDGLTIFHIAVMHRHQGIYNLLYEITLSLRNNICIKTDGNENNMLHLIGKSSKAMAAKTSGASLLMQRELLWFKEVEKIMPPLMIEMKNEDDLTPYELFSKENEDLVSRGLKWMKDCMVVATLIITVAFAVAFTVPGGYEEETGFPIFIHGTSFLVFVIADAMSLFSSTTSLLMFLSILVSRHDQRDFMYSLPEKLMIGLVTLFISVAAMMVTFSASFFMLYHHGLKWVPILIAACAAIPVIMFAVLQYPLLVDMFRSTYDSHYLFNPKKHMLYTKKPTLPSNYSPCSWC